MVPWVLKGYIKPTTNAGINLRWDGSMTVFAHFKIMKIGKKRTQFAEKERDNFSLFDDFLLVCIL